ncbi:MAG TPA: protein kinase [Polyangiaceae bacterium]
MSIETGQVIDGKYRVVKLLGKGGMGAVYQAEHMVIGRRVALKVLLGSVAENETAVARFEREAQAAARIGNDHILEIYDFGSLPDGARYMVCELLEGETLAGRMEREHQLSPAALVPLVHQLLSGLGAAHAAGVVHRDLKPENVFVLRQKAGLTDFVKIIDFGISKFQPLASDGNMQMTATGIVVGTPCYLSPEQARGSRDADARSDLYAVGVIMYEAVTGQLPFDAQNVNDLLFKIVLEDPRPILTFAPQLDPAFARIIEIAMARNPDNRFASADAFAEALEGWASTNGIALSSRRVSGIGTGTSMAARSARSSGDTRSLAPTPGTWADSKVSVSAFQPRFRSRKGLVLGALGIGALITGGAFALLNGSPTEATGSAASSAPVVSAGQGETSAPPAVTPSVPDLVVPVAPTGDPNALLAPLEPTPEAPVKARPTRAPKPVVAAAPRVRNASPKPAAASAPPPPPPATEPPKSGKQRRDYGY